MNIFSIRFDSDNFQSLVSEDLSIWKTGALSFDGGSKEATWTVPRFRVYNPKLKKGSFIGIGPGTIGIWESAVDNVRTALERAGELLPIKVGDEFAWCINVTQCVDCLDHERSEWVYGTKTGKPIRIKRYVFKKELVPESSLFKIPETAKTTLLAHVGLVDDEDNFLNRVMEYSLDELIVEPIFRSEPA